MKSFRENLLFRLFLFNDKANAALSFLYLLSQEKENFILVYLINQLSLTIHDERITYLQFAVLKTESSLYILEYSTNEFIDEIFFDYFLSNRIWFSSYFRAKILYYSFVNLISYNPFLETSM